MPTIAERLSESYREDPKPGPWFPRASQCGGCLREYAHLAAGFPARPPSPESLRTFELGHQRGAELARRAKEIWPDAELEMEVQIPLPDSPYVMFGHVDLWIPSLRTIVDFKTAGGFKMALLLKGPQSPKRCDMCMGNGYMETERAPWKVACLECRGTGVLRPMGEGAGEDYEMQLQAYRHGIAYKTLNDNLPTETWAGNWWDGQYREIRCVLIFEAKDSDARNGVTAGMLHEVEVPHTAELEERFQQRLRALAAILRDRDEGKLDPTSAPGVYGIKGKDWRCKERGGVPLYCRIGPELGKCRG